MSNGVADYRIPPQRRFENYILTRIVDSSAGLTDIPDAFFTQVPGTAGQGATDDAVSNPLPIGFDFDFDGVVYKQWSVCTNGWMALVDPTTGTFNFSEVLDSSTWINTGIKSTFTSQAVLLAPWFDDLRNVANDPDLLSASPFSYSATKIARIKAGLEPPPVFYNPTSYGCSYYFDQRSQYGRRLIIRWASVSNYAFPSSVVRFEVVIYENGTVEFRYTPRTALTSNSTYESATIGIFMPGGLNRFRDFSVGLGYRENSRQEYIYGGYAYEGNIHYLDASKPYTCSLLPSRHWPGQAATGCILRFIPPKKRRRVLPRKLVSERDSRASYPIVLRTGSTVKNLAFRVYDDRKSPEYVSSVGTSGSVIQSSTQVNYPSTLPRFFGGNGLGTSERQDLFAGDFLVTGSVVKSAIDQYVDELPAEFIEPFSEIARPDQGPSAVENAFFTTGSTSDHLSQGFNQNLRSKTQVRFTLPVHTKVTMPAVTSSIYYYNTQAKAWEVPAASTYVIATNGSTPPAGTSAGDWANPIAAAVAGQIIEDARGFGPIGNLVSSGSGTPTGAQQTDPVIGSQYDHNTIANVVGKRYDKSVRNDQRYQAVPDETFTLPINTPFLIEKAVFEIPISAGPGWFADKTKCFLPLVGGSSFDFAGPALTVALYRQVMLSERGERSVRDLILTGTITHANDNVRQLEITSFSPHSATFQIRPVGFLSYAGPAGAVVNPNENNTFTGSVEVQAAALSAAGVGVRYVRNFTGTSAANRTNVTTLVSNTSRLILSSTLNTSATVAYVSPLGRGGTGFDQAGRAVLGNEFVTFQGLDDQTGRTFPNPFLTGTLSAEQQALLTASNVSTFNATAVAMVPVVSHFPAPYLVMPGDKLVLSISKMRPHIYGNGGSIPANSGSLTHDINLQPGNINVTLYGSLIQEGEAFHDTLNQNLVSNVVHELIGAEPVLDQFELAYRNEYTGSYTDIVMLGNLTPTSTRDRKLSKLNARNVAPLTTSSVDVAINPSKAYRAQPWYEKVSDVRHTPHNDPTERFWDSMMPSIADCFKADGASIFISPPGTFGDFRQVDADVTGSVSYYNPKKSQLGWVMLDNRNPNLGSTYNPIINGNWNRSFPFEPRYQGVSRQLDIARTLIATYYYQPYSTSSPVVAPITPTVVNGLIFGTVGLGKTLLNVLNILILRYTNYPMYEWFADSNLSGKITNTWHQTISSPAQMFPTASMASDDYSRVLFGFGDRNTCYNVTYGSETVTLGTNHFPDSRDVEGPHPDGFWTYFDISNFRYSPVIRGWKYGVYSGIPAFSKAYFRRNRFGQFRDMLEQRPYSKFYQSPENSSNVPNFQQGVQPAPVTVTFLDPSSGRLTAPDNTWSSNLHFECTSSFPFFDGTILNRPTIKPSTLNLHPNVIRRDLRGNIRIG